MELGYSIVHLSDTHFGAGGDIDQIEALEALVPELDPRVIVLSGDITQRARHGEFQRALAFTRNLGRAAPVYVIPGNHDVQWWRRPLVPVGIGRTGKYEKYSAYFGPVLTPTLETPEAVITGALTSHGLAWGSIGLNPRELTIRGHLPRSEARRVKGVFAASDMSKTRVLVLHHNLVAGPRSRRTGLVRQATAQKHVLDSGADIVLCGHDHHDHVDLLHGVTVVTTGTISSQVRHQRPPGFHRISFDNRAITVELYRWERNRRLYHRSDVYAFARRRIIDESKIGSAAR